MAKVAKTAIKKGGKGDTESKNFTKVIKSIKNPTTGSYSFREKMVHKEKVNDYLSSK